MSDVHTVLLAPKLLNLINVRTDDNAITLIAGPHPTWLLPCLREAIHWGSCPAHENTV